MVADESTTLKINKAQFSQIVAIQRAIEAYNNKKFGENLVPVGVMALHIDALLHPDSIETDALAIYASFERILNAMTLMIVEEKINAYDPISRISIQKMDTSESRILVDHLTLIHRQDFPFIVQELNPKLGELVTEKLKKKDEWSECIIEYFQLYLKENRSVPSASRLWEFMQERQTANFHVEPDVSALVLGGEQLSKRNYKLRFKKYFGFLHELPTKLSPRISIILTSSRK